MFRHQRSIFKVVLVLICLAGISVVSSPAAQAQSVITVTTANPAINADGLCSIREAMENANNNAQIHADCPAGTGADVVNLNGLQINFNTPAPAAYDWNGHNALPLIVDDITLQNGALNRTFSTCDGGQGDRTEFRFMAANINGMVITLDNMYLRSGCASDVSTAFDDTRGGAINVNRGILRVNNSRFDFNYAEYGGAIRTGGAYIANSSFRENRAIGGAIGNQGSVTLVNSTITRSRNKEAIRNNGTLTVINSTIAGNFTQGINNNSGTVTLHNTILANNSQINCVNNGTLNSSHSYSDDNFCNFGGNNGADNAAITFGAEATTSDGRVYLPVLAGPSIDGGSNALLPDESTLEIDVDGDGNTTDAPIEADMIRQARIIDTIVDAGAVEYGCAVSYASPYTLGTNNGDFVQDLRDAIICAHEVPGENTIVLNSNVSIPDIDNASNGLPVITSPIVIEGNGYTIERAYNTCASGDSDPDFRIFDVVDTLELNGVTLQNGCTTAASEYGGALRGQAGATLIIRDSLFQANAAPSGGAIWSVASLRIANSTFTNNVSSATTGGAIAVENATNSGIIAVNSTFSTNSAATEGGAIQAHLKNVNGAMETMFLHNVTIVDNSAGNAGGGLSVYATNETTTWPRIHVFSSIISSNTAPTNPECDVEFSGVFGAVLRYSIVGENGNNGGCFLEAGGYDPILDEGTITLSGDVSTVLNTTLTGGVHPLVRNSPAIDHSVVGDLYPELQLGFDTTGDKVFDVPFDIDRDNIDDDPFDVDQPGNARVFNGFPDAGAVEIHPDSDPTIASLSPADDATGVAVDTSLTLTFDEAVEADTGSIELRLSSDDSIIESFDAAAIAAGLGTTTVTNDTVTVTPSASLNYITGYYVLIDSNAILDVDGFVNSFTGISDKTTWNFTTQCPVAAPTVSSATELIGVINCINNNITPDTISLGADISLSAIDNGINGLPVITSDITIDGQGFTLERAYTTCDDTDADPDFRLLEASTGTLTLKNITLQNCCVMGAGGGAIYLHSAATVNVVNSTLRNNQAAFGGGAILSEATLNVVNSTLSANVASGSGGALFGGSTNDATIINSTISGNSAIFDAGAIHAISPNSTSIVRIYNSTITGNSAGRNGGALHLSTSPADSTTYEIYNSIISGNTSQDGFECRSLDSSPQSKTFNSVVGQYGSASGCTLTTSTANNLVPGGATGTVINTTLADNGGSTLTHALVTYSPAINAGNNTHLQVDTLDADGDTNTTESIDVDQTQNPRIFDVTVDAGAVEALPQVTICSRYRSPYTVADASDLVQALECANQLGLDIALNLNGQNLTLTGSYASYNGATALPEIITTITIQNGMLTGDNSSANFRALHVGAAGNLTLDNVTVQNFTNDGSSQGGAILVNGTLLVNNSTLTGNTSQNAGGAISGRDATITLQSSTFNNNAVVNGSGGVSHVETTDLTIIKSDLESNSAANGGALNATVSSTLTIVNSRLRGNTASGFGGAISSSGSTATLTNTLITGNTAVGNTVLSGGGAGAIFLLQGSDFTINNSTISGNRVSTSSRSAINGALNQSVPVILNNTLVYDNIAPDTNPGLEITGTYTPFNSLVGMDPRFTSPVTTFPSTGGDYTLQLGSIAINAGDNARLPADTYDLDNDGDTAEPLPVDLRNDAATYPRVFSTAVDMGAYEYETDAQTVCSIHQSPYTPTDTDDLVQALLCTSLLVFDLVIDLNGQTHTLSSSYADYDGATALPSILANITLQNGALTGDNSSENFRALFVAAQGNLTLENVTIQNFSNENDTGGGAIRAYGTLQVNNSTFTGNTATGASFQYGGGAIYGSGANITLQSSTFSNNTGESGSGGALSVDNTSLTIINSDIESNSAGGGGALNITTSTLNIVNSRLRGNTGSVAGGAILSAGTTGTLTGTLITGNTTGGIESVSGGSGSAIFFSGDNPYIINNSTISGNRVTNISNRSGINNDYGNSVPLVLNNTIVYDNIAPDTDPNLEITGLYTNNNSLVAVDPSFISPVATFPSTGGDYTPGVNSVAINAGDNALLPVDTYDLDGDSDTAELLPVDLRNEARVSGTSVDMGTYEYQIPAGGVAVTVEDVTAAEDGVFTFTATLNNAVQGGFSVAYAVNVDNDSASAEDFVNAILPTGTLTFAGTAGEQQIFTIPVVDDAIVENSETFTVTLSSAVTFVDVTDTATGTITNNDIVTVDVNQDGFVTPTDAMYVINRIGTADLTADVDGDGVITESDVDSVRAELGSSR